MNKPATISYIFISLLILITSCLQGCNKDMADETDIPRNYFEGIADNKKFAITEVLAMKDASDSYLLLAANGDGGFILASFQDSTAGYYPPIEGSTALQSLADGLTQFVEGNEVQAILELLEFFEDFDISNITELGRSFLLLIDETGGSYSYRGGITLTKVDHSINRIYGFMDLELTNVLNDSKFFTGRFEDILYLDCSYIPCL